jgi:hypothetical protein
MTKKSELVTIFRVVGRFKEDDKANKERDLIREFGSFIGGEIRIVWLNPMKVDKILEKKGPPAPMLYVPDTVPFNFWGAVRVVAEDVIATTCRCQWYAHDDFIED